VHVEHGVIPGKLGGELIKASDGVHLLLMGSDLVVPPLKACNSVCHYSHLLIQYLQGACGNHDHQLLTWLYLRNLRLEMKHIVAPGGVVITGMTNDYYTMDKLA
jgi:hypothetical protein